MRVAAIDIGSNSVRLLVADASKSGDREFSIRTVARAGEPCRLARGLGETGRIGDSISTKAAQLAADFVDRSRALGARRVVIGATAALRDASNGADVALAIGNRVGVPVRILTGDDEARLTYRSVVIGLGSS